MTNPIETIEMLKTLLDKELITSDEYDSRRSQVLDGLSLAPATGEFTISGISELIVQVEGPPWAGWDHSLSSDEVEVSENFYRIRVPNGGSVRLTIRIEALEEPRSRSNYFVLLMKVVRLAADGHQPPDHTYERPDDSCALCMALRELAEASLGRG